MPKPIVSQVFCLMKCHSRFYGGLIRPYHQTLWHCHVTERDTPIMMRRSIEGMFLGRQHGEHMVIIGIICTAVLSRPTRTSILFLVAACSRMGSLSRNLWGGGIQSRVVDSSEIEILTLWLLDLVFKRVQTIGQLLDVTCKGQRVWFDFLLQPTLCLALASSAVC